jgi:nucleoside-diphosphate-sugar epimerase
MRGVTGAALPAVYADPRPGDIRHSGADISRARAILDYRPSMDLAAGLRDTLAWYRARG